MIICICNALSDHQLKDACGQCPGDSQAETVLSKLNCTPSCGQCLCMIEEMMGQAPARI